MTNTHYHFPTQKNHRFLFRETNEGTRVNSAHGLGTMEDPFSIELAGKTTDNVDFVLNQDELCSKINEFLMTAEFGHFEAAVGVSFHGGCAENNEFEQTIQIRQKQGSKNLVLGISPENLSLFFDQNGDVKKEGFEDYLEKELAI